VPVDFRLRIPRLYVLDELLERDPLFGREVVFRLSEIFLAHAADHADANSVSIARRFMRSDEIFGAAFLNLTVTPDDPVIANVGPALSLMPLTNISGADVLAWACCRAVYDDVLGRCSKHVFLNLPA